MVHGKILFLPTLCCLSRQALWYMMPRFVDQSVRIYTEGTGGGHYLVLLHPGFDLNTPCAPT